MKRHLVLFSLAALALTACGDNQQAKLEQQLKAQQEQINQQQAKIDELQANGTVYQLNQDAVNDTLSADAQDKGKSGETVTGNDGQQYVYDQSTGSWFLQSLVGAAAGAFIGNAIASKFSKAPANNPVAQKVRTHYAQQYRGKMAQAPATLSPRQQAAADQMKKSGQSANTYRPTNATPSNYQQPRRSNSIFGGNRSGSGMFGRGFRRR